MTDETEHLLRGLLREELPGQAHPRQTSGKQ